MFIAMIVMMINFWESYVFGLNVINTI